MSRNKFIIGDVRSEQQTGAEAFVDMAQVKEMIAESEQNTAAMIERFKYEILEKAGRELSDQIQTDKISLITIFGIFASFFTFLTIEVQVLKDAKGIGVIIGFSLILWALLLTFPIALDYLIASRVSSASGKKMHGEGKRLIVYGVVVAVLFAVGIMFVCWGG